VTTLRERADAAAQVLVADVGQPALDDGDAHHLFRVLRLRDGEQVVASDGRGTWRTCVVARGALEPLGETVHEPRPPRPVAVWLPALKGERAEWAVQKLTELGADEIGLLACDRGAVRLDATTTQRVLARWQRVAREATCQARRAWLPDVAGPLDVAAARAAGVVPCELDGELDAGAQVALAVGPEGGWSPTERDGVARSVGLGATVLRTETAAVCAGVLLVAARRTRHDAALDAP
jgi:16S rRNA (uracil1498-N3)-methyltransferase